MIKTQIQKIDAKTNLINKLMKEKDPTTKEKNDIGKTIEEKTKLLEEKKQNIDRLIKEKTTLKQELKNSIKEI